MNIHLIWAQDENGGIGKCGKLPWHLSEDLQNFKKITLNSTIIMGRKTWESLTIKPLPKRRNIVLTSSKINNVEYYDTINNCLQKLKKDNVKEVFIIGGAEIYKNFFKSANTLHITLINKKTNGIDTWFPISMNKIKKTFQKIEELNLSKVANYSKWIKI
ncbi:MAG: dihydrofolate reductase [Candidatus Neomarinimicrobiota bacterium]|nr:dihydrofolate reductase [Candidatus Neomarinimicrobiota bacterium]